MPVPPSEEVEAERISREVDAMTATLISPNLQPLRRAQPDSLDLVGLQATQVISLRGRRGVPPGAVYIGRGIPRLQLARSKWANPFLIGRDGDRADVLRKYTAYLLSSPTMLANASELYGHTLACWCHPLPCHGDILAVIADRCGLSGIPADPEASRRVRAGECLWDGGRLEVSERYPSIRCCSSCRTTYRPELAVFGGTR